MHAYLLATGVAVLLALGAWAGRRVAMLPGRWWIAAYAAGPVFAGLVLLERSGSSLAFQPPFSLFLGGRAEYVLRALILAVLAGCVAGRARAVRWRWLPLCVLAAGTLYLGIAPILASQLVRQQLARCPTRLLDGVCIQSTAYTCGPTAAVTALRAIHVNAREDQLALRAGTNPVSGTQPDDLCSAIRTLYGPEGVEPVYEPVGSLDALRAQLPAIVVTSDSLMRDHYVAVLGIDATGVTLGDPACGPCRVDRQTFAAQWHGSAIVFQRPAPRLFASAGAPALPPLGVIPVPAAARPAQP